MKNHNTLTIACLAGGLLALTAVPSGAQHSSGGTPPAVTEGKAGTHGGGCGPRPGTGRSSSTGTRSGKLRKKSRQYRKWLFFLRGAWNGKWDRHGIRI